MKTRAILAGLGVALLWAASAARAQEVPGPVAPPPLAPPPLAPPPVAPPPAAAPAPSAIASAESFERLRAPEGPAFAILGLAPSEIQKPTTPKEVAVSLSQLLDEEGSVRIPDSFAMQLSPYWLVAHDRLTYEEFAASDGKQLLRNLTLSLAASGATGTTLRDLGAGVSTHIGWGGRGTQSCKEDKIVQLAADTALKWPSLAGMSEDDLKQLEAAAVASLKDLPKRIQELRQACAESLTAHPHSLALAAAWAWQFPDMTGGDGDLVTQAYWATYAWSSGRWSALGLARLRFEEAAVGWDGFVDGGGRVRYGSKGAAISAEALARLQVRGEDKQDARSRLALVVELELKADSWLSLTLGKTFESEGPVALVSLTSSFGTPEVAPLAQ